MISYLRHADLLSTRLEFHFHKLLYFNQWPYSLIVVGRIQHISVGVISHAVASLVVTGMN